MLIYNHSWILSLSKILLRRLLCKKWNFDEESVTKETNSDAHDTSTLSHDHNTKALSYYKYYFFHYYPNLFHLLSPFLQKYIFTHYFSFHILKNYQPFGLLLFVIYFPIYFFILVSLFESLKLTFLYLWYIFLKVL